MAKTQGMPYIAFPLLQIMHVSFFKSTTNYWADLRKEPSKVKPSPGSLPPCIREIFCVERGRFVFALLFLDVRLYLIVGMGLGVVYGFLW